MPRRLLLKLYVPSRHCAVAPLGGAVQFSGRGTVFPLLLTYEPLLVQFDLGAFDFASVLDEGGRWDCEEDGVW